MVIITKNNCIDLYENIITYKISDQDIFYKILSDEEPEIINFALIMRRNKLTYPSLVISKTDIKENNNFYVVKQDGISDYLINVKEGVIINQTLTMVKDKCILIIHKDEINDTTTIVSTSLARAVFTNKKDAEKLLTEIKGKK